MAGDWWLRPYDPVPDRSLVESLWRRALAPAWPLLPAAVDRLSGGFVAIGDPGPVGFVAVDPTGSLPLIMVDPTWQRRGIGASLLAAALADLGVAGVDEVRAGAGAAYIWPGVPLDLPAGVAFFTRRGWRSDYDCLDLTLDLRGYRPPAGIYRRAREAGVAVAMAADADRDAVLAFESTHFPQWVQWFEGGCGDVVIARGDSGRIVGSLLYEPPDAGHYQPMLGPRAGTIGCVGVEPTMNDRGIGSAMVAYASEVLRDAGTRMCHIGWAVREQFYSRVGYRPWRRYRMFRSPTG
jgi:beta-N-acetylhexosaminidase